MNKFKNFALNRPFLFGLSLVFVYALLGTLTYPVHFLFPENEVGQVYGDILSKLLIAVAFLVILWQFDWLKASGITHFGNGQVWLIVAIILVYKIPLELYAFTGDILPAFPNPPLAIAKMVYYFPASLIEELMCRALILVAMMLAWGNTKWGQVKAIVLSSLVFGLTHLFNIFARPLGVVIFQAVVVTLPGILYGALVLTWRSLWPAIILHWITNAVVNVKLIGYENYQDTFSMWIIFGVVLLPLVAYSGYLMWKLPDSYQLNGGGNV